MNWPKSTLRNLDACVVKLNEYILQNPKQQNYGWRKESGRASVFSSLHPFDLGLDSVPISCTTCFTQVRIQLLIVYLGEVLLIMWSSLAWVEIK